MKTIAEKLSSLCTLADGQKPLSIMALPASGSSRRYFRIFYSDRSYIGAYNNNVEENRAFTAFTLHFLKKGLKVPGLIHQDLSQHIYILEDLGDTTLFSLLQSRTSPGKIEGSLKDYYFQATESLLKFQLEGGRGLDYSLCYPRPAFDRQSMKWDLSYFKYYFLKLAGIDFNEQRLEDDFDRFISYLNEAPSRYFMYRDFQSRNIMVHQGNLYFIDYQGGRRGALQYDLASLLFDAKAALPESFRDELLGFYLSILAKKNRSAADNFLPYFSSFVLVRILQALGAYGYRGYFERKDVFLASIPYAVRNLSYVLSFIPQSGMPEMYEALKNIIDSPLIARFEVKKSDKLKVKVSSFSYKNGLPVDESGHGGGFIFDCRFLPNPGREAQFSSKTGLDKDVAGFISRIAEADDFFRHISGIADSAVENYLSRNFTSLQFAFGCTGGQHRSVYFAEKLARTLKSRFSTIEVEICHRELEKYAF